MTSSEEVAEKLRNCGVWLLDVSSKDKSAQAVAALAHAIGTGGNYSPIFNRLADLIDPTCHLALDEELSQDDAAIGYYKRLVEKRSHE